MINTFILSFKIRNTYFVNSIIYSLSRLPIIGKLIEKLQGSKFIKGLARIIAIIISFIKMFASKIIYYGIFIYLASANNKDIYVNIFFYLAFAGIFLNTFLFNPTKDKYYAIFNLRMDAKKYVLSNYLFEMLKLFIGSIPATILFGHFTKIGISSCIFLPLFTISLKTLFNVLFLNISYKTGRVRSENKIGILSWFLIIIFFLLAYLPLITKNSLKFDTFMIIAYALTLTFPISIQLLFNFKNYRKIYKKLLLKDNIIFNMESYSANTTKNIVHSQLKYVEIKTNKTKMTYFNEIFTQRHKKLLLNSSILYSILIIIIFVIIDIIGFKVPIIGKTLIDIPLNYLPYFMFIMYALNRGENVTRAYFMNCDHSMLNYNFFKEPKNILNLFKERLKTLIKINMIPSILISIGLLSILVFYGSSINYIYYLIIPLSIISMSIFFSVHYLVLYYLLQPYNLESELISGTYRLISGGTYFAIYSMLDAKIPTIYFGTIMIIFSVIYVVIALILAYTLASKTFRIR